MAIEEMAFEIGEIALHVLRQRLSVFTPIQASVPADAPSILALIPPSVPANNMRPSLSKLKVQVLITALAPLPAYVAACERGVGEE